VDRYGSSAVGAFYQATARANDPGRPPPCKRRLARLAAAPLPLGEAGQAGGVGAVGVQRLISAPGQLERPVTIANERHVDSGPTLATGQVTRDLGDQALCRRTTLQPRTQAARPGS
jgi:hypothetical protein